MTKNELLIELEKIGHPAINYSLIKLGILNDVELVDKKVSAVFAFPFPNIPIADTLINSVALPLQKHGLDFDYKIRIMSEEERMHFLQLEAEAWKG
jgi:metal-sulfur cluster biosynthetic enzyme